ncbi:MAG: DUF309 domain-containing protein [Nitrosopumilales archaeon]|nr:DUF309 domain-containing protein [Nitrosopumilales archaeon]
MRRYIIHLENLKYISREANWLLKTARSLVSDIGVIVRDTRVASRHVEFDTSVPENISMEEVLRRFATISPISEYEHLVEKRMGKHEAILKGRDLFNDEKYWGAHEALESVWKNAHHEERDLLNRII